MLRAILHADKNWGIGKNGSLMFSLPKDMKFFRETTSGKTVAMGGATLRSFPGGKPLKNRVNIVLSRGQVRDDCIFVRDEESFKTEIKKRLMAGNNIRGAADTSSSDTSSLNNLSTDGVMEGDVYVVGGASIYKMLLPYCREVLVTKVDAEGDADAFFPDLDKDGNFIKETESEPIEDNGYTIKFVTYLNQSPRAL